MLLSSKKYFVLILYAMLRKVLGMLYGSLSVAIQKLRFKPSSSLVPRGIFPDVHRLWKVRLVGCLILLGTSFSKVLLKFF